MSISPHDCRRMARRCIEEAELSATARRRQMCLEVARLYSHAALQFELREASALVRSLIEKFHRRARSRAMAYPARTARPHLRLVVSR
jgi:hypothetical protein